MLTPSFGALSGPTGLDLSVVNQPQDGRATFNDLKVDVRINAVPTLYGPKLVMRLLPHNQNFNLENLKLKIELKSALMNAAGRNQGLIIISGPTGSGKTTTLYSLLNLIDSGQKNICTVENPIEYRLPGITQVDISEGGLSFAAAMRAMLRQDPDVILLGEIRDAETAKVAIHAAATGHLVLSTLHANSASEVPSRLNQLGIDPMSISSTLLLSFAQRLVPLLCPKCSKKCTGGRGVAYFKKPGDLRLINPDGCKHCSSGIIGRYPIAEIAGDGRMPKLHSEDYQFKSTQTLYEHACYLAEKGRIDYREALALI